MALGGSAPYHQREGGPYLVTIRCNRDTMGQHEYMFMYMYSISSSQYSCYMYAIWDALLQNWASGYFLKLTLPLPLKCTNTCM